MHGGRVRGGPGSAHGGKNLKEGEIIDRIRRAFPASGIGDDAAVLEGLEGTPLFAADAVVEGVHFNRAYCTISQAVQKAVTSNVSDIYAMGGEPRWIVLTAGLPKGFGEPELDEIVDGLKKATGAYNVDLAGGDTVLCGGYVFNVAIVGTAPRHRAVARSGAKPGDSLVLFGECGASRAGMLLLSSLGGGADAGTAALSKGATRVMESARSIVPQLSTATTEAEIERMCGRLKAGISAAGPLMCAKRHLVPFARPAPRILLEGERPFISAMIDVSDGIARDLRTLCRESGVGAVVKEAALPVPRCAGELFTPDGDFLTELVLSSGEEYVTLSAVRDAVGGRAPGGGTEIGSIVPEDEGVTLITRGGRRVPLHGVGFEHEW